MAEWIKLTPKQKAIWEEWVAARPPAIRDMIVAYNFRPNVLYKNNSGQRVKLISFFEDSTVMVAVLAEFNMDNPSAMLFGSAFDRNVFGVKPDSLTECDLPPGVEVVDGAPYEDLSD